MLRLDQVRAVLKGLDGRVAVIRSLRSVAHGQTISSHGFHRRPISIRVVLEARQLLWNRKIRYLLHISGPLYAEWSFVDTNGLAT